MTLDIFALHDHKTQRLYIFITKFGLSAPKLTLEGTCSQHEPTDSEPKPFDSEEEDDREEEIANANLEWMTQGPLALPAVLYMMPKRAKRMNIKFNPNSMVKAEDRLDNFYLHCRTLRYGMTT